MRWTKTWTVITTLLSLLFVTVAIAQQYPNTGSMYRGSKLIGADVENRQGEDLGDIKDVVIDPQTGRVAYVVLAFGGFLGLGEKYFAIPFSALTPATGERRGDQERYILNIDQERLKNAPGFERNNWPNMADRTWGERIYSYYGVPPYWEQRDTRPSAATTGREMQRNAMIPATVQHVDQSSKLLTIKTANNEIVEMQAPAALLSTLQAGDSVEVVIHKDTAQQPVVKPLTR
jgi:sporulation protein YlmC with PRC-barrel domain/Cu/Ag efflux protein CusF